MAMDSHASLERPRTWRLHFSLIDPAEVLGEKDGVTGTFAKRRQVDGDDIESIEEVLAEASGLCEFRKIAIGSGYDANIDLDRSVAAHAHQFAFLKYAQQLGLKWKREFGNFVEEGGAAVSGFEQSFFLRERSCERTLLVSEEFALKESLGDGSAVDGNKGACGTRAVVVNRARGQFFASATLSLRRGQSIRLAQLWQ